MKKIYLAAVLALLMTGNSFACSCMGIGNYFCETLLLDTSIATVVMVRKTSDYQHGMKVELIQHFSGDLTPDTFTVWGDNGALCRLYTGGWNVGDTIILALHYTDLAGNIITPGEPPYEQEGDYHISGCGFYALNVDNGEVHGYVNTASVQHIPLAVFSQMECLQVLSNPEEFFQYIRIFPNPTAGFIQFAGADVEDLHFSVIGMDGKILVNGAAVNYGNLVDLHFLAPGVYNVMVWNEQGKVVRRLVKEW